MKKLLILMMALVMAFSFAACGGDTSADPADEQAMADADYEQLMILAQGMADHDEMFYQAIELAETTTDQAVLLDWLRQVSENSQLLWETAQGMQLQTSQYEEHMEYAISAISAIAQHDALAYEAAATNDESLMDGLDELLATYEENMDAFFTVMGV